MKFLKIFAKWQFWASLLAMGLILFLLIQYIFGSWLAAYTHHNEEIEIPAMTGMNLADAVEELDKLSLTYEIDSARFNDNEPPFAVLEYFPGEGFKVKRGRKIFIKANPAGWRPTELPDIVGKSKRLAYTQLELAGLSVGDTIYEPDLARDAVLRVLKGGKEIKAGTSLPRFAKVDLVLGKGLEYGVKMPELLGLDVEEARESIFANQFDVGMIHVQGPVTDSTLLKVFYQYPIAGDNYDQGLPVDLWVSESEARSLNHIIKELDRQFRNFGPNDSLATIIYEDELNLRDKEIEKKEKEEETETETDGRIKVNENTVPEDFKVE